MKYGMMVMALTVAAGCGDEATLRSGDWLKCDEASADCSMLRNLGIGLRDDGAIVTLIAGDADCLNMGCPRATFPRGTPYCEMPVGSTYVLSGDTVIFTGFDEFTWTLTVSGNRGVLTDEMGEASIEYFNQTPSLSTGPCW